MITMYLSSTLEDLSEYRRSVKDALGGEHYAVKESYDAASGSVRDNCLDDVDQCDVYIGIFANRYGWKPRKDNPGNKSITELEYRRAIASGKPRLIFLLDRKNQAWVEAWDDRIQDPEGDGKRMRALWDELRGEEVHPALFTTPADLAVKVLRAIQNWRHDQEKREKQKFEQKLRDNLPSMHPEARHPHPRQLSHAALLLYVAGTDDPQARLLESALQGPFRIRTMQVVPDDPPTLAALDAALADCRTAGMLVTRAGLGRLMPHADAIAPLLDLMRYRTQSLFALTAEVPASGLPAQWGGPPVYDLGSWLAAGNPAISGQLAGFIAGIKAQYPVFDLPGLVGLPYTLLAMTRDEAQRLRDKAEAEDSDHSLQHVRLVTERMGPDWIDRYGVTRMDWKPFGDRTAVQILRDVARDINDQEFVPRRDQENLRGNKIHLRPYLFEPEFRDNQDRIKLYLQMKQRGCIVLVDELSLHDNALRRAARHFLTDQRIAVVTLCPIDPALQPFEQVLCDESPIDLGNLLTRFRDYLDPQCELAVASRSRLRRWLRQSLPEALGGVESEGARPNLRAMFRQEVFSGGHAPGP